MNLSKEERMHRLSLRKTSIAIPFQKHHSRSLFERRNTVSFVTNNVKYPIPLQLCNQLKQQTVISAERNGT